MMRAMYSARLALFIHGITSAERMHEVQQVVLVEESNTHFKCIRWIQALDTLHNCFQDSERLH